MLRGALTNPILPKTAKPIDRLAILPSIRRGLAPDDVIQVGNGEVIDNHATAPCVFESLDAVRREDQVNVEWPVFELHKVLAPLDVVSVLLRKLKAEVA